MLPGTRVVEPSSVADVAFAVCGVLVDSVVEAGHGPDAVRVSGLLGASFPIILTSRGGGESSSPFG